MRDLGALIVFAFVTSVTPGPNNALLWASGLQFGFRATLPHVLGAAAGVATLAVAVATGIGAVVTAAPAVELTLKIVASAYLLLLALKVAGGHAAERERLAGPLGFRHAAVFQLVNPKVWLLALAAMTAFRPEELPVVAGSALVVATMTVVVLPSFVLWAAAGTALHRLAGDAPASRALSAALALLLAAGIAFIWI